MQDVHKEFRPTSWAIDNKMSIYIVTVILSIAGMMTYSSLPKEQFPEVVLPQIYVATVYPGASPADVENLVTRQIEKQVKSITGVKKVTSNSVQDFSNVIIEFDTDVKIEKAKQEVQDAVDKARTDLPKDLPQDPQVVEIDISELPIMNVNVSGDFSLETLKGFAEQMQEKIESLSEINKVNIVGALDRQVQVNVDMFKAALAGVTMDDIENAIKYENMIVSGGQLSMDGMKRSLSVNGEFTQADQIANTVVTSIKGGKIYVKDIAEVIDTFKEKESFARLDGKNVITLNVIKRGGENLINASDKINGIVDEFKANILPDGVKITITADQSDRTRMTLHDLINTIIIGFILVTIILMFFMGATNAIFVGLSVPISSFIAFLVISSLGYTLNMIVLFSFLLALGIVVDDAIVVIENTHRIYSQGKLPIKQAAKVAAGEVFLPVLSGTLVVLGPFVPLAFWPGVIGNFMYYLPITLIITLLASLFVAYIINPVFAVDFMEQHGEEKAHKAKVTRGFKIVTIVMGAMALVFYVMGNVGMGNFVVFIYLIYSLHKFYLVGVIQRFQETTWPRIQERYKRMLEWCLVGWRPVGLLIGTIFLFGFSIWFTGVRKPGVVLFPARDPNFVFTYIKLPIGTDQKVTDSITREVEKRVNVALGANNGLVESVISNVAIGASENPFEGGGQASPHLGKVTVAFVEFEKREGRSTKVYLDSIRGAMKGIKGALISVDQEHGGPPTGKPVNIEINADDFDQLVTTANRLKKYLDSLQVSGVEELKSDFQSDKPEIVISIDREKANREGISTGQIGGALRTAIYGKDISRFREGNEDFPITLRLRDEQRNDINTLMNIPITFRDMAMGGAVRQVPLSSIAKIEYSNSYAGIKRIDLKRTITLSSNVLSGFTPAEVVKDISTHIKSFKKPDGVNVKMTGEQENMKETSDFLGNAGLVALGLIFIILVLQFNSIGKPLIILSEIVFSLIGVLLGFSLFKMDISIIMSGIGVMALAGIVVRNGILLVEFSDLLIEQGAELKAGIAEAAKTRMTPVLLTAMAAILGLIPLAVGLNIDFVKLFTHLNPDIYFGGDNVAFWGPLSWTMIFGLIFGTFLTLFLVPSLYLIRIRLKAWASKLKTRWSEKEESLTPLP